jgi:serine/threonine protein kinase
MLGSWTGTEAPGFNISGILTAYSRFSNKALTRLMFIVICDGEKRDLPAIGVDASRPNRKPPMIELSRYAFETLREDEEFAYCRGRRDEGELPTILLVAPVSEHPVPAMLERLEHQYSLRDELDSDWAARPLAFVRREGRPMLILEDPGGEALDRLLGRPMELSRFLRFAVGLAAALGKLHQQGLIHKDIKPANILADSASGAVWLTGFGIASRLPREHQPAEPPEMIAGTLAYMAPEQTGRMNRSIDSQSDLYSLGVTFYEMLTGALPFSASDPMEWVCTATSPGNRSPLTSMRKKFPRRSQLS